jgi:hypothetical protein
MLTRRRGLGFAATVAAILISAHSNGFAAPPDKACSLLTSSEITAQVGGPGNGRENEVPAGRGTLAGQPTKMCTWTVSGGTVRVSFVSAPNTETVPQDFQAMMKSTMDRLKATGWAVDQKPFGGNATCWSAMPPADDKSAFRTTGCAGVANSLGISVGVTGPAVDMEKVKKLLDAAMSRTG